MVCYCWYKCIRAVRLTPKGGMPMMTYEAIAIIFSAMSFIVLLITLVIYIVVTFSKRK